MSEREQTTAAEEREDEESRPLESADLEKVVGGTETKYDQWHKLPDGSGSGAGE